MNPSIQCETRHQTTPVPLFELYFVAPVDGTVVGKFRDHGVQGLGGSLGRWDVCWKCRDHRNTSSQHPTQKTETSQRITHFGLRKFLGFGLGDSLRIFCFLGWVVSRGDSMVPAVSTNVPSTEPPTKALDPMVPECFNDRPIDRGPIKCTQYSVSGVKRTSCTGIS